TFTAEIVQSLNCLQLQLFTASIFHLTINHSFKRTQQQLNSLNDSRPGLSTSRGVGSFMFKKTQ
ncbi:MAG: hypothetical protein AB8A39_04815, partial [Prochlorococcus sp.]